MKISMIEPVGGHGGLEFYDFGLCEAITLAGGDVVLFTSNEFLLDVVRSPTFKIRKVFKNIYGKRAKSLRFISYLTSLVRALVESKLGKRNIAHFHIFHFSLLEIFGILLFKMFNFRIVATVHDVEPFERFGKRGISTLRYWIVGKASSKIITHNEYSLACVKEKIHKASLKYSIIPSTDIDFVYNHHIGMDTARKILGISSEEYVILFFGQIKKVKGVDVLIKAMNRVQGDHVTLLIVGKTWKDDINYYRDMAKSIQSISNVRFVTKYIENTDVPCYFKASNLVILPYKKIYNSSVVLRAMDYGVPVVASDLPFFKEVISDGNNGLLFRSEDEESLADKINYSINNPEEIKRMTSNASKLIATRYSFREIGHIMNALYRDVI